MNLDVHAHCSSPLKLYKNSTEGIQTRVRREAGLLLSERLADGRAYFVKWGEEKNQVIQSDWKMDIVVTFSVNVTVLLINPEDSDVGERVYHASLAQYATNINSDGTIKVELHEGYGVFQRDSEIAWIRIK